MNDLAQKARSGDEAAERELFRRLLVRFRRFAEHAVGGEAAEEVAQLACITIFGKYREEEFTVSFSAWAHGVYRNTLLKSREQRRSERRQLTDIERLPDLPAAPEISPSTKDALRACLKELLAAFPRYARILNLRFQGYATEEVCERVGVSREQYYVYLGRGRGKLRRCLGDKGVSL